MTSNEARTGSPSSDRLDDDRLNEDLHTIMREAADRREERKRINSAEDAAEAKRESDELLSRALAGRSRP